MSEQIKIRPYLDHQIVFGARLPFTFLHFADSLRCVIRLIKHPALVGYS